MQGNDPDALKQATERLSQSAMKLGEAMYKAQQAETQGAAGGETGESGPAEEQPGQEDVVDAEFSEVDEENKGS